MTPNRHPMLFVLSDVGCPQGHVECFGQILRMCDIAGFRAGIFFSSLNLECSQKGVVYLPNAKTKYFYNLDYSSLLVAIQSIEIQMY